MLHQNQQIGQALAKESKMTSYNDKMKRAWICIVCWIVLYVICMVIFYKTEGSSSVTIVMGYCLQFAFLGLLYCIFWYYKLFDSNPGVEWAIMHRVNAEHEALRKQRERDDDPNLQPGRQSSAAVGRIFESVDRFWDRVWSK